MQRMEGNLAATLSARIGEIGHVQIADSPGRGEPECRPTKPIEKSLAWLPREARGLAGASH